MKQNSLPSNPQKSAQPIFQLNLVEAAIRVGWMLAAVISVASGLLVDWPTGWQLSLLFGGVMLWFIWLRSDSRSIETREQLERLAWSVSLPLAVVSCCSIVLSSSDTALLCLLVTIWFAAVVFVSDVHFGVFFQPVDHGICDLPTNRQRKQIALRHWRFCL